MSVCRPPAAIRFSINGTNLIVVVLSCDNWAPLVVKFASRLTGWNDGFTVVVIRPAVKYGAGESSPSVADCR